MSSSAGSGRSPAICTNIATARTNWIVLCSVMPSSNQTPCSGAWFHTRMLAEEFYGRDDCWASDSWRSAGGKGPERARREWYRREARHPALNWLQWLLPSYLQSCSALACPAKFSRQSTLAVLTETRRERERAGTKQHRVGCREVVVTSDAVEARNIFLDGLARVASRRSNLFFITRTFAIEWGRGLFKIVWMVGTSDLKGTVTGSNGALRGPDSGHYAMCCHCWTSIFMLQSSDVASHGRDECEAHPQNETVAKAS